MKQVFAVVESQSQYGPLHRKIGLPVVDEHELLGHRTVRLLEAMGIANTALELSWLLS